MTEGNFVDYVKMHVTSGNGGGGAGPLRRGEILDQRGPRGGGGGRRGSIAAYSPPEEPPPYS